ncbi:MAG: signal peptide peptidase SppA [Thermodesulfobacteriota bacterium]
MILPLVIVLIVVLLLAGGLGGLFLWLSGPDDLGLGAGVGVIEIDGVIVESSHIVEALNRFRRSEDIKAIIIRIDSPGGGVAATQEIYKEIRRTAVEKKVIASMGGLAASGGLYVASAADRIVANPATVTGSVGVIMQMVNLEELLGKVGFRPVVIKSGKYKDMGSAARPMTEEERALLQQVVDELHRQFVRDLARGRHLEEEKVAALADGRIFTGEQALALKLVDELGNFEDAVTLAGKLAGLEGRPHLVYPKYDKPWWKELLSGKTPLNVWPEWTRQPLTFQYLYLPGL